MKSNTLTTYQGDCLKQLRKLPAESVQCVVTSPPYWRLRDYGIKGQIGMEKTSEAYIEKMVAVFREVNRVLRNDGTLWLNLGDSYSGSRCGAGDTKSSNKGNAASRGVTVKSKLIPRGSGRWGGGNAPAVDGLKSKDLCGIPWRVALALQGNGWYLRSDIIWYKPNAMPESVTDRPTKSHEYIFLFSKARNYYYDSEAIKETASDFRPTTGKSGKSAFRGAGANRLGESSRANRNGREMRDVGNNPTRNKRDVWSVATTPYKDAHFATFPPELIKPCILAGCPAGGTVLDPFGGSGTTGMVALELGRKAVLIELNPEYVKMQRKRCEVTMGLGI